MRDETPRTRRTTTDGVAGLTPRQRQVLALLAEGVPAKVIAVRLGLAEPTVRNHIRAILRALGCHSQLEALARARRLELV
jgi:DNA-binding NarL/FixJ family response regulator